MIYEPAEDSFLLAEQVRKYAHAKRVLDMGAGSAILSKTALDAGALEVTAAEIDCTSLVHLHQIQGIKVISSDLFSNIEGIFDLIVFNPPYLPRDKREDKESQLATTGGLRGDEIIYLFLRHLNTHLKPEGVTLIVLSSLTPRDRIRKILQSNGLKMRLLSETKLFMEKIQVYKISHNSYRLKSDN